MQDEIPDGQRGGEQISGPDHLRRAWATVTGKAAVVLSLTVAVGVGVAAGHYIMPATRTNTVVVSLPAPTNRPATPPPTAGPTSDLGSPAPSSSSGPSLSSTAPATGTGAMALANLTPVSGGFDGSGDPSPSLNGSAQTLALVDAMGGKFSGECKLSGTVSYNLGHNYTLLTGLLGIDDASPDGKIAPTVQFLGDGLSLATFTPKLGHPVQLSLNVGGVLRLEIKWSLPTACVPLGSNPPGGYLVVGNASLATAPGYQPSVTSTPSS